MKLVFVILNHSLRLENKIREGDKKYGILKKEELMPV
jgi:hypothetical protein